MAHGVRSGIMSLTVSALLTCYRSRFQTWILPLPPCIIEALNQRLMHGVFGYSRWKKR